MSQAPSMPVFTDALIGDTTHLSMEEFGAYCMILMVTWRNNAVPLPDDADRMARICRVSVKRWAERLRPVLVEFFDVSEGTWRQGRLEKEWNYVQKTSQVRSVAGKMGAEAKALKYQKTAQAKAEPELKQNASTHTHTHKELTIEADASMDSLEIDQPLGQDPKPANTLRQDLDAQFGEWWAFVPKKASKGLAAKAFKAALKRASFADLLAGIQRYAAQVDGSDPRYVKHPATWLTGDCWLDEPPPVAPNEPPRGTPNFHGEIDHGTHRPDARNVQPRFGTAFAAAAFGGAQSRN